MKSRIHSPIHTVAYACHDRPEGGYVYHIEYDTDAYGEEPPGYVELTEHEDGVMTIEVEMNADGKIPMFLAESIRLKAILWVLHDIGYYVGVRPVLKADMPDTVYRGMDCALTAKHNGGWCKVDGKRNMDGTFTLTSIVDDNGVQIYPPKTIPLCAACWIEIPRN